MNTQENKIELLTDILDQYENNTLNVGGSARKVYLTEEHQVKNIITWIHDHELRGHLFLRGIAKNSKRDLLRQTKEKL